ncbi:probable serine/threonine-protein kinase PBL19 [Cucurbita moschata]|uniref:non-specific serine/threonine protein kinase n=1 Tax=Cucurbita moschata TaxID=3662 RepID=A0A6J1EZQ1_CUCMO|nr:probable serine/threonine-protein kinase PBL19 [Cucurbita moschata]
MGCFFNLHRKTKIKRGEGSAKELNQRKKSDGKTSNRGVEALETLATPRSIPELYKEKEHNLRAFTLEELKIATNGFSRSLRIGEGGFGSVYKGKIRLEGEQGEEVIVAIKRLKPNSTQGHKQWLAEVQFLGVVSHPNLVKLLGYCSEDGERGIQRLLVYEFMSNGSLEDHLFSRSTTLLTWKTRLQIILGAAQGLAYLHEGLEVKVIYRDFKSSNVLLDEEFCPKLSDFGLAREGPTGDRTHVSTAVVGTYGYAAPEYVVTGHLTMQSDIWSFGVVLYEILTGRRALERNMPTREQKLLEWVKQFPPTSKSFKTIIDLQLQNQYNLAAARKVANLADQCLNKTARERPTMSKVVEILKQALEESEGSV